MVWKCCRMLKCTMICEACLCVGVYIVTVYFSKTFSGTDDRMDFIGQPNRQAAKKNCMLNHMSICETYVCIRI